MGNKSRKTAVMLFAAVISSGTAAIAIGGTVESAFASPPPCRPISGPVSKPVSKPVSRPVGRPVSPPVGPKCRGMSPPISKPVGHNK